MIFFILPSRLVASRRVAPNQTKPEPEPVFTRTRGPPFAKTRRSAVRCGAVRCGAVGCAKERNRNEIEIDPSFATPTLHVCVCFSLSTRLDSTRTPHPSRGKTTNRISHRSGLPLSDVVGEITLGRTFDETENDPIDSIAGFHFILIGRLVGRLVGRSTRLDASVGVGARGPGDRRRTPTLDADDVDDGDATGDDDGDGGRRRRNADGGGNGVGVRPGGSEPV